MAGFTLTGMKVCTKCGERKPITAFGRHKGKDHAHPSCLSCNRERGRRWYGENREARQRSIKAYAEAHREERRAYSAQYYQENRERLDAMNAAWYRNHPEVNREQSLRDYYRHTEKRLASMKAWRQANPEIAREIGRRWRAENPEQVAALKRNYKARKKNAAGSHTAEDIQELYAEQNGCCHYCGTALGLAYHVDHRIPLSREGSNDKANLALTCQSCNLSKGDLTDVEFIEKRKKAA